MREETSFRKRHPIAMMIAIISAIFITSWGGMVLLSVLLPGSAADHFPGVSSSDQIGVVELRGLIATSERTVQELTAFRNDRNIKAIVLRVDSPGGAVGASQEIFNEVRRTDKVKPVVASMASIAASGGYYSALGARRILANPGTLTGSIGVIVKFANLEEVFSKIGYRSVVIKSGEMKDIGASNRPMLPEERRLLQDLIDNVHSQFVADVGKSRKLPLGDVIDLADGRIFSGEQALEAGLIDQFGSFTDAVRLAAELAGLGPGDPRITYPTEKNFSFLKFLTGESGGALFKNLSPQGVFLAYEWNLH